MTPEKRRRIVTSVVLLIAGIILVVAFLRPQGGDSAPAPDPTESTVAETAAPASTEVTRRLCTSSVSPRQATPCRYAPSTAWSPRAQAVTARTWSGLG